MSVNGSSVIRRKNRSLGKNRPDINFGCSMKYRPT